MSRKLCVGVAVAVLCVVFTSPAVAQERVSASQKGSLLYFAKVELRWNNLYELIQDTFIDITNDYPQDVAVQLYFINGDPYLPFNPATGEREHPGCNWIDNGIELTADEPTYWSAATGLPKGVSPFTVLDFGSPPGRPDFKYVNGQPVGAPLSDERVLRGYVVGWAVSSDNFAIRWNHLKGDVLIVNYAAAEAWEYNAWAFQAIAGANGGVIDTQGELRMDGAMYQKAFSQLLLDFYASGSEALSAPPNDTVLVDTDLTLLPVSVDLRQDNQGPVCTKAKFDIWNMNEVKFSGAEYCICCWDQRLLSHAHVHFLRTNLQTDKGKARILGMQSQVCPDSENAAILGVAAKYLDFNGGAAFAIAGSNLVGMGEYDAILKYDVIGGPGEANQGKAAAPPAGGANGTKLGGVRRP